MASWTPEFCTVCDKQCLLGSVYCSDKCREADFQKTDSVESVHHSIPISITQEPDSASETSEEDDEVPNLWLTNLSSTPATSEPKLSLGANLRSKAAKIKETSQFLYVSPTLKPTKGSAITPAMSPLFIPRSSLATEGDGNDHMSSQSVNTYKRWLAHGAH